MRGACRAAGTLALLAIVVALAACAHMQPPPGGPEDRIPPFAVMQRPDSFAVVPGWQSPVELEFSERISEQGVEEAVMVSPRTSPVRVDRGSRSIRVALRAGWEAGQIYHVTIRPQIQDLFNNRMTEQLRVVFSTGPEIPENRLAGTVVDRITGEPQLDLRVEAIRSPDSLVYAVPTDSSGRFVIANVPEGEYLLRAFPDRNLNRQLDVFEERDSIPVTIALEEGEEVRLSIVMPDSTPPIIASASATSARRIEVQFDDYLDPEREIDASGVSVSGPDGVTLPVVAVGIGGLPPEDTAQVAGDSIPLDGPPALGAIDAGEPEAAPDTAEVDGGAATEEPVLPSRLLTIQLAPEAELQPDTEYGIAVRGAVNIVGLEGDSEATFTGPAPPPPPDPAAPDMPDEAPEIEAEAQPDAAPGG